MNTYVLWFARATRVSGSSRGTFAAVPLQVVVALFLTAFTWLQEGNKLCKIPMLF